MADTQTDLLDAKEQQDLLDEQELYAEVCQCFSITFIFYDKRNMHPVEIQIQIPPTSYIGLI